MNDFVLFQIITDYDHKCVGAHKKLSGESFTIFQNSSDKSTVFMFLLPLQIVTYCTFSNG